jgi:hypothetical protein
MERFNADTGHAILTAARLDNLLQLLLLAHMPPMSNVLAADLFERGALSTFSAKIDLARALGLIDIATRRDLRAIKNVRNVFAHAEERVRFASAPIVEKAPCQKQTTCMASGPNEARQRLTVPPDRKDLRTALPVLRQRLGTPAKAS